MFAMPRLEQKLLYFPQQIISFKDRIYKPKPDIYAFPKQVLDQQARRLNGRRWALFSDVNGTVEDPKSCPDTTLAPRLTTNSWLTVYGTGGNLSEVIALVNNGRIPAPHIVVSELAGPIHILKSEAATKPPTALQPSDYVQDPNFSRKLKRRFDKEAVMKGVDQIIGHMTRESKLAAFNFRYRGDVDKDVSHSRIRLEFTVPPVLGEKRKKPFIDELKAQFATLFPGLKLLIFQETEKDRQTGYHKILLAPWGKEEAIKYLQKKLGVNGAILAGDSGIDPLFDPSIGTDTWRVPVGKTLMAEAQMQQALQSRRFIEPIVNGSSVHKIYVANDKHASWDPTIFIYDRARRSGSESVARAVRMADLSWKIHRRQTLSRYETTLLPAIA